jgi:hypothetical protein
VKFQIGKWKGAGRGAIGFPVFREELLKPVPREIREREIINDLLSKVDHLAGRLFYTDMVDKQPIAEEGHNAEDNDTRAWGALYIR